MSGGHYGCCDHQNEHWCSDAARWIAGEHAGRGEMAKP
jgi:hypothetical protein